jgi:hypothetical protein
MIPDPVLRYLLHRNLGLEVTNPVFVVKALLEQLTPEFNPNPCGTVRRFSQLIASMSRDGMRLPGFYLDELRNCGCLEGDHPPAPTPGVVGLVVDLNHGSGFVVPLRLERADPPGDIDRSFPFTTSDLHDAFAALIRALQVPAGAALPERLYFRASNLLGRLVEGQSMHIGALLAALDALTGHAHGRLRGACAIVELGLRGQLRPVGHLRPKLEAFCREYRRGTLLVCAPGCAESAPFRGCFERVWEVTSFADLARELETEGLLKPLLAEVNISEAEWRLVQERLDRLVNRVHDYPQAIDLGGRLLESGPAEPMKPAVREGVIHLVSAAHRHLGQFAEAERSARGLYETIQGRGLLTCQDEKADAAVEYVASFYDAHRFEDIAKELGPWLRQIITDPGCFRPPTRVKVFNTLGRALMILGQPEWEGYFRRSLELQRELDPGGVLMTSCFLIHGLLRHGKIREAGGELEGIGPLDRVSNNYSRWSLGFFRADLARRNGQDPVDPEMEGQSPRAGKPNHLFAFYQQAVARQVQCPDPARRLKLAADFCRSDAGANEGNITCLFAAFLDLAAAAWEENAPAWKQARDDVDRYLRGDPRIRAYYLLSLIALPAGPDRAGAERLLERIPYL